MTPDISGKPPGKVIKFLAKFENRRSLSNRDGLPEYARAIVKNIGQAALLACFLLGTATGYANNAPVFGGGAVSSASVQENNATAYDFSATDADANDVLVYSLSGNDAARFVINSATGELTFSQAFDFENPTDAGANNGYDVNVSVSDGNDTVTQAFALTVTNVNDPPAITSGGGGSTAGYVIDENATAVTTVTAQDDENSTLTFSLTGGADAAKFEVNATSGALRFSTGHTAANPTDADGNSTYEVIVTVSEGVGTDTQAITAVVMAPPIKLAGAEYFVDNDPGEGNGTVLQAADGAFDSEVESVAPADLNVTGLSEGPHLVGVRYKDDN
ncbi:uncharacterized protein METZ01_LOCUS320851, partial [marine metagenome]